MRKISDLVFAGVPAGVRWLTLIRQEFLFLTIHPANNPGPIAFEAVHDSIPRETVDAGRPGRDAPAAPLDRVLNDPGKLALRSRAAFALIPAAHLSAECYGRNEEKANDRAEFPATSNLHMDCHWVISLY